MKSRALVSVIATAFTVSVGYANAPQQTESASVQSQLNEMKAQMNRLEAELREQKNENVDIEHTVQAEEEDEEFQSFGSRFTGARNIGFGTGQAFGLDSDEDGGELLITAPQLNKDYNLLLQNQAMDKIVGTVEQTGSRVQISGTVQGSFEMDSNPFGQVVDDVGDPISEQKSDLLGQAEFDLSAQVNDWWTGYMHFFSSTEPGDNVEMEQAFLVLGDLDRVPTYASAGLMFASSGYYFTNMISRPLPREIGRFRTNVLAVGTVWDGWRANAFIYDNEREKDYSNSETVDKWGASVDYVNDTWWERVRIKAGLGYVNDISTAEAYDTSDVYDTEGADGKISRSIPSGNIYLRADVAEWIFYAEYQDNFRSFKSDEIGFNGHGAKISAGNFEVTYKFDLGKPSWLTANYGFTREALGALLPKNVYGLTYGVNVNKNVVVSFEYMLQDDYSANDVGYAPDLNAPNHLQNGQDQLNNQFIAQVDLFF